MMTTRLRRNDTTRQQQRLLRLTPNRLVLFLVALSFLLVWANLLVTTTTTATQDNSNSVAVGSKDTAASATIPASRLDVRSPEGGAAACLLVMDDNHLLIEWLAYNYHTLPLRYLVIAVDPRSKTRPTAILDRWRNNNANNNNLTIVEWKDDADYMSTQELEQAQGHVRRYFGKHLSADLIRHRARQRMFYFKCMQHCKQQGRHWTALIDTDEYLTLSYDTLQRYGRQNVPSVAQPGAVLEFLNREFMQPDAYRNITTPCIQIPRIRFGAKESEVQEVSHGVPEGFPASSFQTMRWRWHASQGNYGLNRISKTLIDLSRVSWEELQPIDSIHRPIKSLCGHRKLHIRKSEQALVIHHYLGTKEQYLYRDDARQGNERSETVRLQARNENGSPTFARARPSLLTNHSWVTGISQNAKY